MGRARPDGRGQRLSQSWLGGARRRWGDVTLLVIVGLLFVYPVVVLATGAFRTAPPGRPGDWSFAPFVDAYSDPETYSTLRNSLVFAISKEVIVLVIAVTLAIVSARTDHPLRRLITPIAVIVVAMPPLFFAISWGMLGNGEIGSINKLTSQVFGAGVPRVDVESWPGMVGVTALKSVAIEYLLLLGPFRAMDRSLEESSLVHGGTPLRTILRINLPVMLPAISAVGIIGVGQAMGTLDVPLVIGLPAGIEVFASRIYAYINAEYPAEYGQSSSLAFLLVAVVMALVVLQRTLMRNRSFETVSGKAFRTDPWRLSTSSKILLGVLIVLYALLALALPFVELVLSSFQPFLGSMHNLSLDNYRRVLDDPQIFSTITNSLVIGAIGGFLAMALAVVFAYGRFRGTRTSSIVSLATWIPYALPGVVLSLAILWAFIPVPGLRTLYATIWIVMIGLIIHTVPLTNRVAETALAQISTSLEEAARMSGAGRVRALVNVVVPLVAPSFVAGWFIAFVMMVGNLDVPILMSSPQNDTVAVQVFRYYSAGRAPLASAL